MSNNCTCGGVLRPERWDNVIWDECSKCGAKWDERTAPVPELRSLLSLIEDFQNAEGFPETREIAFRIALIIPISYDETSRPFTGAVCSASIYISNTGMPLCPAIDFREYRPNRICFEWSKLSLTTED